MIPSLHRRNKLLAVLLAALIATAIACGQDSSTSENTSSSIEEPPAPETQQEAVEAVPDLPTAPDFALPAANRDNTEISLSSFQGDKPVVLVFYRAYW